MNQHEYWVQEGGGTISIKLKQVGAYTPKKVLTASRIDSGNHNRDYEINDPNGPNATRGKHKTITLTTKEAVTLLEQLQLAVRKNYESTISELELELKQQRTGKRLP